jgi:hypothetical protein
MGAAAVFDTAAATPPTEYCQILKTPSRNPISIKHSVISDANVQLSWFYVLIKSTKNAYKNASSAHAFPQINRRHKLQTMLNPGNRQVKAR